MSSTNRTSNSEERVVIYEFVDPANGQAVYGATAPYGLSWPASGRSFVLFKSADGVEGETRKRLYQVVAKGLAWPYQVAFEENLASFSDPVPLGYLSDWTPHLNWEEGQPVRPQIYQYVANSTVGASCQLMRFGVGHAPEKFEKTEEWFGDCCYAGQRHSFSVSLQEAEDKTEVRIYDIDHNEIGSIKDNQEVKIEVSPGEGRLISFWIDDSVHPNLGFALFSIQVVGTTGSDNAVDNEAEDEGRFRIVDWSPKVITIVDDNRLVPIPAQGGEEGRQRIVDYSFNLSLYDAGSDEYYNHDPKIQNRSSLPPAQQSDR